MGLLSRVSRMFGGGGGASVATRPGRDASQAVEMKTTRTDDASTPIDADDPITIDVEDELRGDSPDETVRELGTVEPKTPAVAKKTKQELIEELSKNYQEVLQLVRKMSDHIDREADREERVVALSSKVDEIRDALATMPDRINENANTLNARIVEAIDRQALAEQGALDQMIEQSRKSGEAQGRLITTMAEFRETMHDVSQTGSRSNEILAEMSRNADATREEIAQLIVTSKRWTTVAMVASLSVAVVAILIAAISLAVG